MESCVVCLEYNEDSFSRITTLSSEWIDGKMQRIIEKHLWWWYLKTPSQNNGLVRWICRQCWQEISAFHQFYGKVEKAHRYYQPIVPILQKVKKKREIAMVKLEASERLEPHNTELVLFRDKSIVIPQKQVKNMDKFKEKSIDMNVKTEFYFSSNESVTNGFANANSLNEDMCVYASQDYETNDSNCNEMQSEEDNPLIHEFSINFQDKTKRKIGNGRSRKKLQKQMKTKEAKIKENSNFDHFFKESGHKLECCICNLSLSDFRSLKAHYRNVHNTPGYAMCCGKKFFKRCLLVDHLRVHTDPNFFKCQVCTKTFATRYVFEMHSDTHKIRERKYNCDECGKSYFKLTTFERHKLTHVPDSEKQFNCSQCNKKFASDNIRRYHEDSTHARKYIKICDICGKLFHNSNLFLRHLEIHSGILPSIVTCDICDAKLPNKKELRKHMKIQHLEENQEKICPYCSRVSKNCNAHRMHIKYAHIMQRKHACHLCDKAFRRPLELKEHLSTHTGEALYTCPHCPRTFISNANMYKHRRNAHRNDWEEGRLNKCSGGQTASHDIGVKTDIKQSQKMESTSI